MELSASSAHSKGILSSLLRHINFVERLWEKVIHSSILYAIARDFSPYPFGKSFGPSDLKAMESRPLPPLRMIRRDIDDNTCLAVP